MSKKQRREQKIGNAVAREEHLAKCKGKKDPDSLLVRYGGVIQKSKYSK